MSCNPLACLRPLRCPSCDARPSCGLYRKSSSDGALLKPPLPHKICRHKGREAEYAALEARARASNLTLSEWVRDVLLASSPEAGSQVVLAEVLALRTILMNLLFSIARGEAVTPEQMQALIERADKDKVRRALEKLASARGGEVPSEAAEPVRGGGAWRSGDVRSTRTGQAGRQYGLTGRFFVAVLLFLREHGVAVRAELDVRGAGIPGQLPDGLDAGADAGQRPVPLRGVSGQERQSVYRQRRRDRADQEPDGRPGYELTEAGMQAGAVRLRIGDGVFSNAWMRQTLGQVVYGDRTVWDYIEWPVFGSLGVFVVLLFYAVPKDRKRGGCVEAWAQAARARAGHDGGVQREAGAVERVEYRTCRTAWRSSMKSRAGWTELFHKNS